MWPTHRPAQHAKYMPVNRRVEPFCWFSEPTNQPAGPVNQPTNQLVSACWSLPKTIRHVYFANQTLNIPTYSIGNHHCMVGTYPSDILWLTVLQLTVFVKWLPLLSTCNIQWLLWSCMPVTSDYMYCCLLVAVGLLHNWGIGYLLLCLFEQHIIYAYIGVLSVKSGGKSSDWQTEQSMRKQLDNLKLSTFLNFKKIANFPKGSCHLKSTYNKLSWQSI